jgi:hypothetical protein
VALSVADEDTFTRPLPTIGIATVIGYSILTNCHAKCVPSGGTSMCVSERFIFLANELHYEIMHI